MTEPLSILEGHALPMLRTLPSESVQVIIVSPPYYRLRDYQLDDGIWDETVECEHEWGARPVLHKGGPQGRNGQRENRDVQAQNDAQHMIGGAFCGKCQAWKGQLGLEPTVALYIKHLVDIFREARRVLRPDGTMWVNVSDSHVTVGGHTDKKCNDRRGQYRIANRPEHERRWLRTEPGNGLKTKDLAGIPWRLFFALQEDGWYGRCDVVEKQVWFCPCGCGYEMELQRVESPDTIWHKPNPLPSSVTDRPSKSHEYVFLLAKKKRYFYDAEAVKEPCESGPSDLKKMEEQLPRIGGKTLIADDPLYAGNKNTNLGKKRGVGDPAGRNRRSVWTIATTPMELEYCSGCLTVYSGPEHDRLNRHEWTDDEGDHSIAICRTCGATDKWGSHFAVFPKELVRPMILASTSDRGACAKCRAPWTRIMGEKEPTGDRGSGNKERLLASNGERSRLDTHMGSSVPWEPTSQRTIGWRPSCKCECEETVPCVVLDFCAGSGTVGEVALDLGRHAILIEPKPAYVQMIKHRTTGVTIGLPLA